jgi:Ca2+/Na+ antiporter
MWDLLLFIAGLSALFVGANALVHGSSKLALSLSISPLVVGLTVVAFGTSAPEVAVSTSAVINGQADIAIGNVVGSNIFNVLFILGLSALLAPPNRSQSAHSTRGAHHGGHGTVINSAEHGRHHQCLGWRLTF